MVQLSSNRPGATRRLWGLCAYGSRQNIEAAA
jgi:hypothetical protein